MNEDSIEYTKKADKNLKKIKAKTRFKIFDAIHDISQGNTQNKDIKKLKNDLINSGFASDVELNNIEKEIDSEVNDAVEFALNAPEPDPSELTKYIWAEN